MPLCLGHLIQGLCHAPSQLPHLLNEKIKAQIKKKKIRPGHQNLKGKELLVYCVYEELCVNVCGAIKVSLTVVK